MKNFLATDGVLAFIAVVFLVQPFIIYCLWDDVMVNIFNVKDITFLDSIWISILFSVLFKNNYSVRSSSK